MRFKFFVAVLVTLNAICPSWSQGDLHPDTQLVVLTSQLIHEEGLNESRLRHPRNKPWFSFSMGGMLKLESLQSNPGDWENLQRVLKKANRNAVREVTYRLDELSAESISQIRDLTQDRGSRSSLKKKIIDAYLNLGRWDLAYLEKNPVSKRAEWLEDVNENLEPTIKEKGRTLRQVALSPGAPFVYGWLGQHLIREYRGPKEPEFEQYLVYRPSPAGTPLSEPGPQDDAKTLLERYAPVIVQEIPKNPDYTPESDLIGTLTWSEEWDELRVNVREPAVYAYCQTRLIDGQPHKQLIYTHWYPEHPKLKMFDAEAGEIEGLTLRITLDSENEPLVFETIYNCGCYHRLYVTQKLEEAARRQFGEPQKGKNFSIEKKVSGKIDLIVLEELPNRLNGRRPVLYCWAAYHLPGKVAIGLDSVPLEGENLGEKGYVLQPYRNLELVAGPNDSSSVFDENGLVRGADRMEAYLLAPTGIFHAGTPRQRGTQLIHFDQEDFEKPNLFEEHLRWPSRIPSPDS
ncbi:MAG: hypothetical protein KC940_05905 [Candidatus Omnitrophica bacterium]|nr:hypothetical protein [Candidatus Omnitrophota bacterium]